jgi:hypothetical protein
MRRILKAKAILHRMIEKYGFILYDIDGSETDLMKDIRKIINLL